MNKQFEELIDFRSGDARPGWAKDGLTNRTTVSLDWKDRIKLLFGWQLEIETHTATENVIGQNETRGCVRVFNPRKVSRMIGVCEAHTVQPSICTREHVCGVEGPCNGFPRKVGMGLEPDGKRLSREEIDNLVENLRNVRKCGICDDRGVSGFGCSGCGKLPYSEGGEGVEP